MYPRPNPFLLTTFLYLFLFLHKCFLIPSIDLFGSKLKKRKKIGGDEKGMNIIFGLFHNFKNVKEIPHSLVLFYLRFVSTNILLIFFHGSNEWWICFTHLFPWCSDSSTKNLHKRITIKLSFFPFTGKPNKLSTKKVFLLIIYFITSYHNYLLI